MVSNHASHDHHTFVETLEPRVLLSTLTVTNANDSGAGSLRQAIEDANAAAGADVIEFDASLNGETIVLTSGSMQITDDLTITGPGSDQLTIDGNDLYRIFENDATTAVSGLLLTQGYALASGGAIYNSATLTLEDVSLTDSYSDNQGGAIYSTGGALTIDGATIQGNRSDGHGGGVAGDGSTLTINDIPISNNFANEFGGGIFTFGGTLLLSNSTISTNECGDDGGGIGNEEGVLTIIGSSVSDNIAGDYGGGLTTEYGEVSIADSSFSGNHAGRYVGGIENEYGPMSITNSTVTNNTAVEGAGGIYNYDAQMTLTNATISGNTAGLRGGGVTNWDGTMTITDSTIADNTAVVSGGGIWQPRGVLLLVRTTVTRSTAASGGGIDNSAAATLIDSVVSECTATDVGGGIRSGDPDTDEPVLTLINSVVTLNTASSGGGIAQTDGTLTITGSSITSNTSTGAGGGVSVTGGTLDIAETTLSGNEAANGGGLSASGLSATIARSTISGNTATAIAGGMAYETTLTMTNSTVSGNTAELGGGIVGEGTATIANCTITGNISADEGLPAGGVAFEESTVTIRSSIIANNTTAAGTPSDVLMIDGTLVGTNNLIGDAGSAGGLTDGVDGNIIGEDPLLGDLEDNGGPTRTHALLANSPAFGAGSNPFDLTTDQRGSVFSRGTSVDIGAYQQQSLSLLVDTDDDSDDGDHSAGNLSLREAVALSANPGADTIAFDALLNGATITLAGGSLAIGDDLTITGPGSDSLTINGDGASGIFTIGTGALVTISGLTLTGGAAARGAAIDNAGNLTLEVMVITGHTATDRGGAISNEGTLAITFSRITDNTAAIGGAVFNGADRSLTITNSTLTGNTSAEYGGAIANEGTLTISLSALDDNTAGSGGGAIDNEGGVISITRSSLTGNTAGDSGGAIWTDTALTITNSTISGNSAGGWGGGIGMYDGTVVISNSTIAFNVADADGDGLGQGGGIDVGRRDGAGTLTTSSTIYAGNTRGAAATVRDDISLTDGTVSGTNNLVQDPATAGGLTHGANGNLVGLDPGLGSLAYNDGSTRSHAIFPSSPAIDAGTANTVVSFDQRGLNRVHGNAADIGAFEWQPTEYPLYTSGGGSVESASQDDNSHSVAFRNLNGDIVVFRNSGDDWIAERLADHVDAPGPFGTPLIWTDPVDGLIYVAGSNAQGFLLFQRGADGIWTSRNLSTELGLPDEMPQYNFTQFVTTGGLVSVAGYNADGELILLQQTGDTGPDGAVWSLRNLSDDLTSRGMATPDLAYITSYVTPWNQWTIAGIDLNGDIQGIWVNVAAFTTWRVDNLSDLYGTPTLSGQLTVIQTSWRAINLAGTDADGNVIVTWWVPSFKGSWAVSDLTENQGGTPLASGRITGWVTSWGAMNFAGLDADGEVVAYWWTPGTPWTVSTLTGNLGSETIRPTSSLDSHVSDAGTMNIVGTDDDSGNVLRLWWTPNDDGRWKLNDLTELAVRT